MQVRCIKIQSVLDVDDTGEHQDGTRESLASGGSQAGWGVQTDVIIGPNAGKCGIYLSDRHSAIHAHSQSSTAPHTA